MASQIPPSRRPAVPAGNVTANAEVDALYLELSDAQRAHDIEKMWKKFGSLALAFALCAIIGTTAFVLYQRAQQSSQTAATADLMKGDALVSKNQMKEAVKVFSEAAAKKSSLQPLLMMRYAEALMLSDQQKEGLDVLRKVAAMPSADIGLRDTARLNIAHATTDPKEMRQVLAEAAKPGAPFAPLAQQMRATLAMAENNPAEAQSDLNAIDTKASDLPKNLKTRTEELRSVFVMNQAMQAKEGVTKPASVMLTAPTAEGKSE